MRLHVLHGIIKRLVACFFLHGLCVLQLTLCKQLMEAVCYWFCAWLQEQGHDSR